LETALQYKNGQIDPLKAAYNDLTQSTNQDKLQQAWYHKGQEELRQQQENDKLSQGALVNPAVPVFKGQPKSREEVKAFVAKQAAQAGMPF